MPIFVTWYKRSTRKKYDELRGCLGTFSQELPIRIGLKKYSVMSAMNDKRFEPITIAELYQLTCSISLLHSFTRATKWDDWELGVHGITINFTDGASSKKTYNATYLPEVPGQQKWNKLTTIENLVNKAGFHGSATQVHNLSVTKYQSCKFVMTWQQYLIYTQSSGLHRSLSNRVRLLQSCSTPQLYHALVNGDAAFYCAPKEQSPPLYEDEPPPSSSSHSASSSSSSLALHSHSKSSKHKNVSGKQMPKHLQSQNKKIIKQSLAAHHNKTKIKTLSMPKFGKTKIKSTAKRLFRYGSKKLSSSPPPPKHSYSHHHPDHTNKTDDSSTSAHRTHHQRHHTHPTTSVPVTSSKAHCPPKYMLDVSPSPSSRSASISKRFDNTSLSSPKHGSPSPQLWSYSSHRQQKQQRNYITYNPYDSFAVNSNTSTRSHGKVRAASAQNSHSMTIDNKYHIDEGTDDDEDDDHDHGDDDDKMKKRVRDTDEENEDEDEDEEENEEEDDVDESELDEEDDEDDEEDEKSVSSSPSPLVTLENAHRLSAKIRIHRPSSNGNNSSDELSTHKSKTHSAVSTDSDTRSQSRSLAHKNGSVQQLLLTHNMQMDGSSSSLLSAHSHRSLSMTSSTTTTTADDAQRKYKPLQKFHILKEASVDREQDPLFAAAAHIGRDMDDLDDAYDDDDDDDDDGDDDDDDDDMDDAAHIGRDMDDLDDAYDDDDDDDDDGDGDVKYKNKKRKTPPPRSAEPAAVVAAASDQDKGTHLLPVENDRLETPSLSSQSGNDYEYDDDDDKQQDSTNAVQSNYEKNRLKRHMQMSFDRDDDDDDDEEEEEEEPNDDKSDNEEDDDAHCNDMEDDADCDEYLLYDNQ
eukprot:CAMPEP_0202728924 /NCGR_PEP_ID=MMETSP1385-20130828/185870_1 /ASSEMBLY_ACC=CAM_ASM_000861 /TAXON_ID=933848 /ORGANISM="Elphidium margaritaceum" /LENGTH=857 /DNA_ID=CAMNT_0049395177 /DNA_START=389 /DNA_END=2962 /DNA_ORIENTATION=-